MPRKIGILLTVVVAAISFLYNEISCLSPRIMASESFRIITSLAFSDHG
jgi:hypothetical protein